MGLAPEELSVGDYVLTGGELAALIVVDAAARLIPGVLGDQQSAEADSFGDSLLDYPHYTRPPVFRGDRKSVVYGKSVDLGGRRIIKKKKKKDVWTRVQS